MVWKTNESGFNFQQEHVILIRCSQISSGAHPMGVISLEVKQQGHEVNHSIPPTANAVNDRAIPPLPHYIFTAWFLIN
jgi:hypothetical protein